MSFVHGICPLSGIRRFLLQRGLKCKKSINRCTGFCPLCGGVRYRESPLATAYASSLMVLKADKHIGHICVNALTIIHSQLHTYSSQNGDDLSVIVTCY